MITNNSYIRSDYGIINKNIIAQTKLKEYDKESNKNYLTTKEYVDSKINNVKVNLCYSIENPYVYEILTNGTQEYITNQNEEEQGEYIEEDIDGKDILNSSSSTGHIYFNNNGYYIGRYVKRSEADPTQIISYNDYKLIKIEVNNDRTIGYIIEKNDINIGQELYSKLDQEIYKFIIYNEKIIVEEEEEIIQKIIFVPYNNRLELINTGGPNNPIEITDNIIFNLYDNKIYHYLNGTDSKTFYVIDNNTEYIKENKVIDGNNYYFDNTKPIYNFYNNYLFSDEKVINEYFFYYKYLYSDNHIINYYSYSGIPKITINNNVITIPKPGSGDFNNFTLSSNYINLKTDDFYVILEKYNEDNEYEYYKGLIELNNNGIIETNTIKIKYGNNNYIDDGCDFESNTINGNLQFILINYNRKTALNIIKTINNNDENVYNINVFGDTDITKIKFEQDLTLMISLNITLEFITENNNNIVKFVYKYNLLSSPNEQRIYNWIRDSKSQIIVPTILYSEIFGN